MTCKSGVDQTFADFLSVTGYPDEATKLRQCIFGKISLLNEAGFDDLDVLTEMILEKVAGLSISENTILGVEECVPVED